MQTSGESSRDFGLQRLEQIEQRYQWAQDQLARATASYETLRERPGVNQHQLRQALQHVSRAQSQLLGVRNEIDQLEDLDSSDYD